MNDSTGNQAEGVPFRATLGVVIPCYNAGDRLRGVVERALSVVDRIWVVDDGSTDDAVVSLGDLPVQRIRFSRNRGKGAALLAGFRAVLAVPELIAAVVVDADGQHDAAEIPRLYEAYVARHADLVIGARTFDPRLVPWRSRFGNRLTAAVTALLFRRRLPDTQSGFRLLARGFLEAVVMNVPDGRYETEMAILIQAIREKRTIVSVPITTIYETGNPSSHFHKFRDSFRIYRTLLRGAVRLRRGGPG